VERREKKGKRDIASKAGGCRGMDQCGKGREGNEK